MPAVKPKARRPSARKKVREAARPRSKSPPSGWLGRWQPSEAVVLGGLALLTGLAAGGGVWVFKRLIDLFRFPLFGSLAAAAGRWGGWTAVCVPVIGGLIVGLIGRYLTREERVHGVAGVIESVALAGGRLRYQSFPVKTLVSSISIGSGASVGPEDPSVQIGANLASMFGQWLHLSDERLRALVAGGAAAGIAAAFNAPIAGIFFALELVLGEISGNALGVVVIASVVSAVVTQAISGPQPAFRVPVYVFHSAWELPLYIGLGVLAGPLAAAYSRLIYVFQDLFGILRIPRWLKPALAGLVLGIVGLFLPQILGVGYETIGQILSGGNLALGLVLALLIAKLILTPLSLGSGFVGGIIAPSLFLGATLGSAYGLLLNAVFPQLQLAPPAFAMVGMAAVVAGVVHAPLTAILLLFEMTNDYRIILPLMFAVMVSLLFSQRLQRDSLYAQALARVGIRIERGRDVEVLEAITVGEGMQTQVTCLRESDSLKTAAELLMQSRSHGMPVIDGRGDLVGVLAVSDLDQARAAGDKRTVGQVCQRDVLVAYPDESMAVALRRMSLKDVGRLPVVERDRPRHLVGILRRSDVIHAYDLALTRRSVRRHRADQVRLGAVGGVRVEEIVIRSGSACAGRRVSRVAWPRECLIATLRRGRTVVIPHGDTVLRAGDVLAVVADDETLSGVRSLCTEKGKG